MEEGLNISQVQERFFVSCKYEYACEYCWCAFVAFLACKERENQGLVFCGCAWAKATWCDLLP